MTAPRPGPILAATLIARDEERCIARCLDSVRPWVDRIILLDTGSSDATPAIAARCGAEVHHLAWPDDFSVARNHALDLSDADWNLIVDADEWIASGGELLRPWCEGPARLGRVRVDSQFDAPAGSAGGASVQSGRSWITRLLPRGVRYTGRVHEQPLSPLPREALDLHIGHDGYRDAQMTGKRDRNRPLLLLELRDHPGDPYILYQLGKEEEGRGDHAAACDRYAEALAGTPPDANWLHELFVRHLHCLGQAGQVGQALDLATRHIDRWQDSPDFFFTLGNLLLERAMADPGRALGQWLPLAGDAWRRCLEIGDRPELEGSVEGRGSHLAAHNLRIMQAQVALLAG